MVTVGKEFDTAKGRVVAQECGSFSGVEPVSRTGFSERSWKDRPSGIFSRQWNSSHLRDVGKGNAIAPPSDYSHVNKSWSKSPDAARRAIRIVVIVISVHVTSARVVFPSSEYVYFCFLGAAVCIRPITSEGAIDSVAPNLLW